MGQPAEWRYAHNRKKIRMYRALLISVQQIEIAKIPYGHFLGLVVLFRHGCVDPLVIQLVGGFRKWMVCMYAVIMGNWGVFRVGSFFLNQKLNTTATRSFPTHMDGVSPAPNNSRRNSAGRYFPISSKLGKFNCVHFHQGGTEATLDWIFLFFM